MKIQHAQFGQCGVGRKLRSYSLRLGLALFFLSVSACSSLQKPFFYRAEKSDRQIDLFGTIHAGVPGWDLPPVVTNALQKSNRAYFEANLLEETKPQVN